LDHIADFLKFISSAQSFWFSLNTSYDHGCHLASHFHLDPDECEVLLIVAGRQGVTASGKIRQRRQAPKREEGGGESIASTSEGERKGKPSSLRVTRIT
jgi:hypothetical protein